MRQIVTGLFETYDDARRAQDALLLKGFAVTDIDLPVPGTEVSTGGAMHGGNGVLAGLERFVSSLFSTRAPSDQPATSDETARATSLRFALQRGAVLIGVRVFDDAHAALARDTLIQQQALQVDEHAADWQPVAPAAGADAPRERSALDELGIGALADAWRQRTGAGHAPAKTVPDEETLRARYDALNDSGPPPEPTGLPADDPAVTALTPAGSASAGAADADLEASGRDIAQRLSEAAPTVAPSVPDEFVEYEEDFRGHHATRYEADGAPFERYQDAYRYGAVLAQDIGNQDRAWSDIEPEARRGWETMVPGTAPHYPWEQVRDAVRHGWERAYAQGGGA